MSLLILFAGIAAGVALLARGGALAPLGPFAVVPGLVLCLAPVRVNVGADGIATRWLRWPAFIPFADIRETRLESTTVVLALRGGGDVRMRASDGRTAVSFLRHVETRRRRQLAAPRALALHELLVRGDRSDDAWRAHLRSLAAGGYREEALAPDELWQLVLDPVTEDSVRIGAAILLRPFLDADGVQVLSRFARSLLADDAREALEQIAAEPPVNS